MATMLTKEATSLSRTYRSKVHSPCVIRSPKTARTFKLNESSAEELSEYGVHVNRKRWHKLPTDRDDIFASSKYNVTTTERKLARAGGDVCVNTDNKHGWLLISTDLGTDLSISAKTPLTNRSMYLGNCQGRFIYAIQGYSGRWSLSCRNQPRGWLTINGHTFTAQELWGAA